MSKPDPARRLLVPAALVALPAAAVYLLAPPAGPMALLVKALPVAAMAAVVAPVAARHPLARWVAVGLGLSAVADVVIGLDVSWAFVGGLGTFLVAHLAYLAGFLAIDRRPRWGALLPFGLWIVAAFGTLLPHLDDLLAPVAVYMLVIGAMMWRAAARLDAAADRWVWLGAAGAVSFGLSDTVLAFDRFYAPLPAAGTLIMVTYWLGQAGLAATAIGAAKG